MDNVCLNIWSAVQLSFRTLAGGCDRAGAWRACSFPAFRFLIFRGVHDSLAGSLGPVPLSPALATVLSCRGAFWGVGGECRLSGSPAHSWGPFPLQGLRILRGLEGCGARPRSAYPAAVSGGRPIRGRAPLRSPLGRGVGGAGAEPGGAPQQAAVRAPPRRLSWEPRGSSDDVSRLREAREAAPGPLSAPGFLAAALPVGPLNCQPAPPGARGRFAPSGRRVQRDGLSAAPRLLPVSTRQACAGERRPGAARGRGRGGAAERTEVVLGNRRTFRLPSFPGLPGSGVSACVPTE